MQHQLNLLIFVTCSSSAISFACELSSITLLLKKLLALYERWEAGQRRPRARHIVEDDLAAIEAHDGAAFRLWVRIARIVPHRLLPLPGLPQGIVHVGVVIDERVRIGADALVFALRGLQINSEQFQSTQSRHT